MAPTSSRIAAADIVSTRRSYAAKAREASYDHSRRSAGDTKLRRYLRPLTNHWRQTKRLPAIARSAERVWQYLARAGSLSFRYPARARKRGQPGGWRGASQDYLEFLARGLHRSPHRRQ